MPEYYVDRRKKVNTDSPEYQRGYNAGKAGCWWRGVPHCSDTQEFRDWLGGWQKADDEGHVVRRK